MNISQKLEFIHDASEDEDIYGYVQMNFGISSKSNEEENSIYEFINN